MSNASVINTPQPRRVPALRALRPLSEMFVAIEGEKKCLRINSRSPAAQSEAVDGSVIWHRIRHPPMPNSFGFYVQFRRDVMRTKDATRARRRLFASCEE